MHFIPDEDNFFFKLELDVDFFLIIFNSLLFCSLFFLFLFCGSYWCPLLLSAYVFLVSPSSSFCLCSYSSFFFLFFFFFFFSPPPPTPPPFFSPPLTSSLITILDFLPVFFHTVYCSFVFCFSSSAFSSSFAFFLQWSLVLTPGVLPDSNRCSQTLLPLSLSTAVNRSEASRRRVGGGGGVLSREGGHRKFYRLASAQAGTINIRT